MDEVASSMRLVDGIVLVVDVVEGVRVFWAYLVLPILTICR